MMRLLATLAVVFAGNSVLAQPVLVGHWDFEEGSGNIAGDSSDEANHGTVEGASWTQADGSEFALHFDGKSYVDVGDRSSLEPATFTVAACVRSWNQTSNFGYIVAEGVNGCVCSSYALFADTAAVWFYTCNGSAYSITQPAGGIWDGEWHILVGSYDGQFVRLFIDGALVGSPVAAVAPNYSLPTHGEFLIGHSLPVCTEDIGGFDGDIDEVRVWNGALSQSEIENLGTCRFFADGFESGDTTLWSSTQ